VWKTFNTEDQTFRCCTGSGIEEYSKLNDSIYWHDGGGLYVSLFIPSELDWVEKGFRMRMETRYPAAQNMALAFSAARNGPMPVRLRIPGWLLTAPSIQAQRQDAGSIGAARQLCHTDA
jgi:DUF1680 family protein